MNRFKENLSNISIEQHGKSTVQGRKIELLTGQYYHKINDLAKKNDIDLSKTCIVLKGEVSLNWIILYLTCLFYNIKLVLIPTSLDDTEAAYVCHKEGSFLYITNRYCSEDFKKGNGLVNPIVCDDNITVIKELKNNSGFANETSYEVNDWNNNVILKSYNHNGKFRSSWVGYSNDNLKYAAAYFAKYGKISSNYQYVIQGDLYMEHANIILGLLDNGFKKSIYIPNHGIATCKKIARNCNSAKVICSKKDFERSFRHTSTLFELSNPWLHSMKNVKVLNKIYWYYFKKKLLSTFGKNVNDIIILGGLDSAMIHEAVESKLKLKTSYTFSTIQTTGCAILIRYGDRKTCELAQQVSLYDTEFPTKGGTIVVSGDTVAVQPNEFAIKNSKYVNTGYYGELTEGGIIPIAPVKDIILGKFDLPINARNLEDLAKDMPYVKDITLLLIKDEYYMLAFPDVELCQRNNIDSVTLAKLFENYKNLLNSQLDEDYKIKKIVVFSRMFEVEDKFLFRTLFK